jgi:SAM-dependent methyltransferase
MPDVYTHGHHDSVLRSHRWRTAENSAAYLLPRLTAGQTLLDVGCGPGTITLDLARHVAPGEVVGIDASETVIAEARDAATRVEPPVGNVRFATGDVYALDWPPESLDVVHAHQVLQHLSDPVAALREMRRVLRTGGTLAVRDSDYGAFVWWPDDPLLDRWNALYHAVTARNSAEADAGRHLLSWVRTAGFAADAVEASASTWTFADRETRAWWTDLWAERVVQSAFAQQAIDYGVADRAELDAIASAFRRWAEHDDGVFIVVHGEVLARKA